MPNYYDVREDLIEDLDRVVGNGTGVEIGVFKGEFSRKILEAWKGTLYMVDVWRPLGEEYEDMSNHAEHLEAYAEAMKSILGLEDRGIMIRDSSEHASKLFQNESLDFVYIDANHSYEFVKKDLDLWYKKLKKGGMFAGHDYLGIDWQKDPNFAEDGVNKHIYMSNGVGGTAYCGKFGVNPAVDEFCEEKGYGVNHTSEWFGTWWLIK